ncbi:MAG: hypothetical protein K0Q89_48 [Thermomicrobiales bacterium]|jgi:hypothetical protein|nr:hypothetical protein [Thermomicrobiales bacterium]
MRTAYKLTCPDCGEAVERTGSGWYRHVGRLFGACGLRLMDVAMRDDGTETDECATECSCEPGYPFCTNQQEE